MRQQSRAAKRWLYAGLFALWSIAIARPCAAGDWQAGAGANWSALLAKAKSEGKVVVAGSPGLSRVLVEGFEHDTGISVDYLGGNTRDITARLSREAESGNVSIDLALGGADALPLYAKGLLVALKPQMILPSVEDGPQWVGGRKRWVDNAGEYMFRGSLEVFGWPMLNTSIVPVGSIHSWKDFLKPEYKGRIAAFDPSTAGQGQGFAAYLVDRFGLDFLKALYIGQDVRLTREDQQLLDWAARGTYPIIFGAAQVTAEKYRAQGLPLAAIAPADGQGYVSSGFSVLKEPKGAPHPNAAAVFANWYASQPGQTIYSRAMLEVSTRTDVKTPEVPEYSRPKPRVEYTDTYSEDYYGKIRPVVTNAVVTALGGR